MTHSDTEIRALFRTSSVRRRPILPCLWLTSLVLLGCSGAAEPVPPGQGAGGETTTGTGGLDDVGGGQPQASATGSGGGGGTPELLADLSLCEAVHNVEHGALCAIRPSDTDPAIRDFNISPTTPGPGFGFHAVGVPNTDTAKGIWVHFGGSFGSPYLPTSDKFASRVWLNDILGEGYIVLQVAYSNPQSISESICNPQSPGYQVDNCSGDARREVLEGVDVSTELDVPFEDSVNRRLDRLLAYLHDSGWSFPGIAEGVDWPSWWVSGHSQGAGHAYYVAKNYGSVFACHLGGPYDYPDAVAPGASPIADWYLVPGSATPVEKLGAFVVTSDPFYSGFVGAYGVMGLEQGVHWFDATGTFTNDLGEEVDGHAASIAAPELAPQRAQACFR